jgi:hypothetical protein
VAGAHVQTKDAQVASGSSVNVALTGVVAGNHLFASTEAFRANDLSNLAAPTSSPSATWANIVAPTTQTGGSLGSNVQGLRGDYSESVASGSWTVTHHETDGSAAITGNVSEASGVAASASAGVHSTGSSGASSVASQAAGSVTPTAGSIMYVFWASASGNTAAPSADNSFVLRSDSTSYDGSQFERAAQFSKDNVAASAVNVTVSESSGTVQMIAAVAEFLPATAVVPATRFRLPSAGTPEVSPATQSYTHTGGTARPLLTTDTSTLTTTALAPDAADHIAAGDTYFFQGVSPRLAGQVIGSGATVKLAIQCLEANAGNNLFIQLWIGIVSPTGTALQTLLAKTADNTELNTTIQSRFMSPTTTAGYTCSGGERLVVEISVVGTPVATSGTQGHNASLRFGGSGAGGDNGENDTDTGATLNPWIEFNPGVLFEVPVYGTPFGSRGQNQMQQL